MTVTIKIPKTKNQFVERKTISNPLSSTQVKTVITKSASSVTSKKSTTSNNNTSVQKVNCDNNLQMEIIESYIYHRANIKFTGGIPSEQIREILKNEGWVYNPKEKLWYPKGAFASEATKNFF